MTDAAVILRSEVTKDPPVCSGQGYPSACGLRMTLFKTHACHHIFS